MDSELAVAQATRWYARLQASDCTSADQQAFQRWLAQQPAHAEAFRRTERLAARITRLAAFDRRLQTMATQALDRPAAARRVSGWRAAAAVLLAVGVAALLTVSGQPWSLERIPVASYANNGMQQQRIELSDGSVVHLDVGSQLEARLGRHERHIELQKGRAFFEVAHDAARPFAVVADGTRTVALGTRFQVALADRSVDVMLAEGSVAVTGEVGAGGWRELLRPGQQLRVSSKSGDREKHEIDATIATGWSRGRLAFSGTPLEQALDEINRYAAVKVRLGDQTLASVPVGGNFIAGGDSRQVVDALAAVLPLRAVYVGASEIVLFQRYETTIN